MGDDRFEQIHALFLLEATNLYNYVAHICPPQVDAQDVVQEVFIKAFRHWHTFKHQSTEKTWLFKIARNHVYDMCRKQKRQTQLVYHLQDRSLESTSLASSIELQEIIASLPPMQQEIVFLRTIQGFSTSETARILGISSTNVRISLHRARKQIAQQWFSDTVDERGKPHGEFSHR